MGTTFLWPQVCFMQNYQSAKFQWSALQIGQDSSIYILNLILGRVFDIISHLVCIFYRNFIFRYLQNQCRYLQTVNSVFLVLLYHGVLYNTPEKNTSKKSKSTHQYSTMLIQYTLHWLSRLVTKSFVFEMSTIAFNNPSSQFFPSSLKICNTLLRKRD